MNNYKRLKELREDNDLSQQDVAKILGTTFQYYSAYERGIRDLPLERAIIIAKYYNVSLDYIAGLTDKPKNEWNKTSDNLNIKNNVIITGGKNNIKNIKIK